MQDRYAGDIGDYGKIGLLKCLQAHGFTIGVNWYRVHTPDIEKKKDGTFKQNDGKHLIPDNIKECDCSLADTLTEIAKSKNRSVAAIQKADLIPNAVYYDEYLTTEGRRGWHQKAMKKFENVELVFMDPDNGLFVKSGNRPVKKSIKYVFFEEVRDYIKSGKSVLVYNHRGRVQEKEYFDDKKDKLQEIVEVNKERIRVITFPKGTVRDYFAIPAPACNKHYEMFRDAFADMMKSKWGRLGVCR